MQELGLLVILFLATGLLIYAAIEGIGWLQRKVTSAGQRTRRRQVELEVDRARAEVRNTILRLASQLGADAHEARKALIRESLRASGKLLDRD